MIAAMRTAPIGALQCVSSSSTAKISACSRKRVRIKLSLIPPASSLVIIGSGISTSASICEEGLEVNQLCRVTGAPFCILCHMFNNMETLVSRLINEVDAKDEQLQELENKYTEVRLTLSRTTEKREKLCAAHMEEKERMRAVHVEEKERMCAKYAEEIRKTQWNLHKITLDNKKLVTELEPLRESQNQKNELIKKLSQEMEKANINAEKVNNCSTTVKRKSEALKQSETLEENQVDHKIFNTLIMKERMSNSEQQEGRKELIKGLENTLTGNPPIRIRRMGEVYATAFKFPCLK